MCGSSPKPPDPIPPPEMLKRANPGVQTARTDFRRRQLAAMGLAGTNRGGAPLGGYTAGKTLLGQ